MVIMATDIVEIGFRDITKIDTFGVSMSTL